MKDQIRKAIVETLVIENPQSIYITVNKIMQLISPSKINRIGDVMYLDKHVRLIYAIKSYFMEWESKHYTYAQIGDLTSIEILPIDERKFKRIRGAGKKTCVELDELKSKLQ